MNAECLLDGVNLLGDQPETVQQLRKLVVGLAASGRLVARNEEIVEPASLLKFIEAKKRALFQQGEVRKQSPPANVAVEDLPKGFSKPTDFVRLGTVARIEKGLTGIAKAEPGPYPLVVTAEDRASCDHFDFEGAAAIVPLVSSAGHGKASLQRLHYQEGKFALGSILAAIFPHAPELISARFLFEYLMAFKEELLVSRMIGTANVSLSVGKVSDVPVPLVSPSVQRKVDELMALCDRLEAKRAEREATRDRLTAASLARLNAPDPETFTADARFALDALPALTARPDQIKQLRETIISLAVRGKLVHQDPADEPASRLLDRIAKEKARLGIKQVIVPLGAAEVPFQLPRGWTWSRIGEVCSKTGSGSTPRGGKEVYKQAGVAFLRSQNIYDDGLRLHDVAYIDVSTHQRMSGTRVMPGDLLLNITGGSIGRCSHVPEDFIDANVSQHVAIVRAAVKGVAEFLHVLVRSPYFQAFIFDEQTGAGRGGLPKNRMDQIAVALPPLAEQHRIVAKVDALMVLCDQMEASLGAAAATRRRLLDALLAEALAPAVEHGMEAAE